MQHMSSSCCKVSGLLVLLAGLSLLAYGLNMWKDGLTVHMAAGLFLTLYAVGKLMHSMNSCPVCPVASEPKPAAKKK